MNASLSLAALGRLPAGQRPKYDLDATRVGIVHLGVGNFHRAHQAVYVDDALSAGESGWAVCGINLRSRDIVDRLRAQHGLYTLLVREQAACARVIGALRETIAYPGEPQRAAARLADPAVRIVTLTITEKGYALSQGGSGNQGESAAASPAIALLADGLARRIEAGATGLTLLSCDNLSRNGEALRKALRQEAARRGDRALLRFIEESTSCPNTMVDRIVPATSAADRDQALTLTGFRDACPVATEPFTQWVIEDRFVTGRPDWARDGVQFVPDVAPFEAMKLRLLNAAHSALAYLGALAGFTTVDKAIAEPRLRAFVERMWREDLVPTLPEAVRPASAGYREALLARFANPSLGHRLGQIAMDGSQKVPVRWLAAARARRARSSGAPTRSSAPTTGAGSSTRAPPASARSRRAASTPPTATRTSSRATARSRTEAASGSCCATECSSASASAPRPSPIASSS